MKTKNIVLVHGAFADGSSWSSVIQRLQKEGYIVTAVEIDSSHVAMVSHPDAVTDLIIRASESVTEKVR
jgi:hypothetical protein